MSNQTLFRIAGVSSILSVLFSFGMFALVGNGRDAVFLGVSVLSFFFTSVVLCALYVFHRAQAPMLALIMLLSGVVGLILEAIGTGPGTLLSVVSNLLYAVLFCSSAISGGAVRKCRAGLRFWHSSLAQARRSRAQ